MDREGEIALRKKMAAEVSSAPKEKLTWDVSAYVRRWVHGMLAALVILIMICVFLVLLFFFAIGTIKAVATSSEYPLTAAVMAIIALLVGTKTVRSYRLMQGTQAM